jgi:hypothetical protein
MRETVLSPRDYEGVDNHYLRGNNGSLGIQPFRQNVAGISLLPLLGPLFDDRLEYMCDGTVRLSINWCQTSVRAD